MATTTTTTCDKCGLECVYGVVRINATTTHWTARREHVGEEYHHPAELCMTCGEIAVQMLGMSVAGKSDDPGRDSEAERDIRLVRPVPLRHQPEWDHQAALQGTWVTTDDGDGA